MAVVREHEVYFAKLAEQAERYDEMANHMHTVGRLEQELDGEERNLLAVAYKQAVGQRRSSWRIVATVEQQEEGKGSKATAASARAYRKKIENEIRELCGTILGLLTRLIDRSSTPEAKVTYYKAEGDYHRYQAEISDDVEKTKEAEQAKISYEAGTRVAEESLAVTSSYRLGLALNHAVFYYEVMHSPGQAVRIARKAFEDAVREIDNLGEDKAHDSTLIMQLLRDNLSLWTSEPDVPGR